MRDPLDGHPGIYDDTKWKIEVIQELILIAAFQTANFEPMSVGACL